MGAVKSLRIERGSYHPGTDRMVIANKSLTPERDRLESEIENLRFEFANLVQEADRRESQAYERGSADGFQQGLAEGRKSVEPAVQIINKLVRDIDTAVDGIWLQCRESITNLTLDIARKVIGQAAENTPGVALELTERCLKLMRDQAQVTIYINPQDAATLRAARADLLTLTEGVRKLEIVERTNVAPGGVILESNAGQLDARIEEQLAAVDAALRPKWVRPASEESVSK
ncbi:MAG: FliH/SctL family protein [Calditrichota bacterium]